MRVAVIGGSGHIGTYLVPRLVEWGYEVVSVSRGKNEPYTKSGMWHWVEKVTLDREKEEAEGNFGKKIAALKPDVVVDLIAFTPASVKQIVEALKGNIEHYLFCSSCWAHGAAGNVPTREDFVRHPIECATGRTYGIDKAACEEYLHKLHRREGFPETCVLPGHITGPGWDCIGPCGNKDPQQFAKIARGEKILIANFGMECLHNVHADDVAQIFQNAIIHRNQALGESFHAVAPEATTMRGLAEKMFLYFGKEPNIEYLLWKEWCEATKAPNFIASTEDHVMHSDNCSIEKAVRLIEYKPRYTIFQAVCECVNSYIERGVIKI